MRISKALLITLSLAYGQALKIDSVVVISNDAVLAFVGERIFSPLNASRIGEPLTSVFGRIRKDSQFLTSTTEMTLAKYGRNRIAAMIEMDPQFESHVSGIVGSGKSENGEWESQGELNFHLENFWATAGAIDVVWNRRAVNSQYADVQLTEPYLPRLPIGIKLGWTEHLQEGITLLRSSNFSLLMRTGFGWEWGVGFRKTTIIPTAMGYESGLTESSSRSFIADLFRNSTDDSWLPTRGISLSGTIDFGFEDKFDQRSSLSKVELESEFYHPVLERWILKTELSGSGTWSGSGTILDAQQVRFGGMESLRGYREDFFRADWAMIPKFEIRYEAANLLHLSAFIETAFHSEDFETPVGYGFGLLQKSDAAVLQVFYGIGRNDKPSDGKIHILLTGRL